MMLNTNDYNEPVYCNQSGVEYIKQLEAIADAAEAFYIADPDDARNLFLDLKEALEKAGFLASLAKDSARNQEGG